MQDGRGPHAEGTMTPKCLIVKIGAIGDAACVLPAAHMLHQSGTEVHWLCGNSVAPLLSCYSWVKPIEVNDGLLFGPRRLNACLELIRTWLRLAPYSFDSCAVLQFDWRYRLLALPVRRTDSIYLSRDARSRNLIGERHHSAEFVRILCGTGDTYRPGDLRPVAPDRLPPNPLPRTCKRRIVLVPGGARNPMRDDPQRRWPLQSYVTLAQMLVDKGHEVILSGGNGDGWTESAFTSLGILSTIGRMTLPETIAFYGSCDCVVTHDTGPLHLAGLTMCGVVGLFGPTAPSKALPRRPGVIGLWGGERLPCRPCYDGSTFARCASNVCLSSITPMRVGEAVESLLESPAEDWRIQHL